MRQEFKQSLGKAAASTQVREKEPPESESTEAQSDSPPRVIHSHWEHLADYIQICMEEGERLTLGEDRAAPLITEVDFSFYLPTINSSFHSKFFSFVVHNLSPYFQALQKIHLLATLGAWQTYCMWMQCHSWKWLYWVHQQPR